VADNSNRQANDPGRADGASHAVRRKRAQRGFTLLEIILVMVIIAVASVLAAAAMGGGFRGMQLGASARQVASNLRFTRAQAIATGQVQRFEIDPHAHAWRAPKARHGDIPAKLGIAFIGAREVQARPGIGAIAFFPDGASTGGRITLTSGKASWTVDVAWLTGQVEVTHGGSGP
jgi:general secretion pathway protein H